MFYKQSLFISFNRTNIDINNDLFYTAQSLTMDFGNSEKIIL